MTEPDLWIASHLCPELPRLLVGAGALVFASYVNFRTGTQLQKAIEVPPGGGFGAVTTSLILFGAGAAAGSIRTFIFDGTTERLRASLAAEVFTARLRAEPSSPAFGPNFDRNVSAAIALDGDVALCAEVVPKLQNVVRYTSSVVGGTVVMFRASWKLTAAVWPLLVTGALHGARAGAKRAGRSAQELAVAREDAMGFAEERLQHADLVRWFSRVESEALIFSEKCGVCVSIAARAAKGRSIAHMVFDFAAKGVLLGLCHLGSKLVQRGELTAGELIAFFFHASFLGLGLYGLVGLVPDIAVAREAARRLMTTTAATTPCETKLMAALQSKQTCAAVSFKDVCFAYHSGKCVLDNFSLDIPAGTSCALVGPSGCGKSTVLSLLLRDYDEFKGSISIDGQDIRQVPRDSVRRTLGVAPQQAVLLGKSVSDSIAFGVASNAVSAPATIEAAARASCAHSFVAARPGGYDSAVGSGGQLLSGGERQRVATARAVVRGAPVLVLDEPTSALDSTTAAAWAKAMLAPRPDRPTTLVITHSLALIRSCDSIAVLSENGRVVQHGTFSALIADHEGALAQIMKAGMLEDDLVT